MALLRLHVQMNLLKYVDKITLGLPSALYSSVTNSKFVPKFDPPDEKDIDKLSNFVKRSNKLLFLTGAGISTESGIPDYRSEDVGLFATSKSRPVQYQDFLKSAERRRSYWARNYVGWPIFGSMKPNRSHKILSEWENDRRMNLLVTQNVDGLHYKAGSKNVVELHGSSHRVHCLTCDFKITRNEMQNMVKAQNANWRAESKELAPDADVQLTAEQVEGFKVPPCPNCSGILKPEIVFFGDNVARPIVDQVYEKVNECDSILVVGSSLYVMSGYRFVVRGSELKKKIAILNIGPTRADKLADIIVRSRCGDVLEEVNNRL